MAKKTRKQSTTQARQAPVKPAKLSAVLPMTRPTADSSTAYSSQPAGYQYNANASQAVKPQPNKPMPATPMANTRMPGLIKPMHAINYSGGYGSGFNAVKGVSNPTQNARSALSQSPLMQPRSQGKPSER